MELKLPFRHPDGLFAGSCCPFLGDSAHAGHDPCEARTTPYTPANRRGTTWTTRCTAWEHLQVGTDGLFEVKVVDKAVD